MTENEEIKVLEKPSKHIRMVHKTKNEMEFYTFSADLVKAFETAIKALEEIQQYRAIGTIEDFKALKEKNEPKKIKGKRFVEAICPMCESELFETYWAFGGIHYCSNCGQKIDWQ